MNVEIKQLSENFLVSFCIWIDAPLSRESIPTVGFAISRLGQKINESCVVCIVNLEVVEKGNSRIEIFGMPKTHQKHCWTVEGD